MAGTHTVATTSWQSQTHFNLLLNQTFNNLIELYCKCMIHLVAGKVAISEMSRS
jgi:hypothetical protein